LAGGIKRLAPDVDAPYGTPLNVITPFRVNPRIFPALVSATVASSEATILLRPQLAGAGCELVGAAVADEARSLFGARAEAVTPAHDAAMPASRVRLPLEKGTAESLDTSECDCFSNSRTGSSFSLKSSSPLRK
jgi:hypothetical protein